MDRATTDYVASFDQARDRAAENLQGILDAAPADVIEEAVHGTSKAKQEAAAKGAGAFPDVSQKDRTKLYMTLMIILGVLTAAAIVGAAWALDAGKDSAAFFTFAGVAVGGLVGIIVPSPVSKS